MKIDRKWGGGRDTAFKGMPPHKGGGGLPAGGNTLASDGSARWVAFRQMLFIHSWNTAGDRDAYMFQDDLGPQLELQRARLAPKL